MSFARFHFRKIRFFSFNLSGRLYLLLISLRLCGDERRASHRITLVSCCTRFKKTNGGHLSRPERNWTVNCIRQPGELKESGPEWIAIQAHNEMKMIVSVWEKNAKKLKHTARYSLKMNIKGIKRLVCSVEWCRFTVYSCEAPRINKPPESNCKMRTASLTERKSCRHPQCGWY